jgi:4a-hydroxytetrahydrobiopterin dehydratase
MTPLAERNCIHRDPNEGLNPQEIAKFSTELPSWKIGENNSIKHIQRKFKFKNFAQALAFVNAVGDISEEQDHHPVIILEWANAQISWWTHTVKGLSENDFIMAAKTNVLINESIN